MLMKAMYLHMLVGLCIFAVKNSTWLFIIPHINFMAELSDKKIGCKFKQDATPCHTYLISCEVAVS